MKLFFENPATGKFILFEVLGNTLTTTSEGMESLRHDFENMSGLSAFLSVEIEELILAGFSQALPLNERMPTPAVVESYFEHSFFDSLVNAFGVQKNDTSASQEFGNLPKNLSTFLRFRGTHESPAFDFGKISFPKLGFKRDNFENAVLEDQSNASSFRLLESFMGSFAIAYNGKDAYICVPHEYDADRAEIWKFDTALMVPTHAIASDISVFLYAHHLVDESYYGVELVDTQSGFEPILNLIAGHPFLEKMSLWPSYVSDSQDHVKYLFNRTYWISYLFRNDDEIEIEDIAKMFHIDIHTPQTWKKTKRFPFIRENPVTQLYWLWRLFWFDRKDELEECIDLVKNTPSSFVISAVVLIEEIEGGRTQVGSIDDIHSLRKKWVSLGLDPAESETKLKEEEQSQKQIAADLETAHAAIETLSDVELYKRAWSYVDNQNILRVWLEHLRHHSQVSKERLDRLATQLIETE